MNKLIIVPISREDIDCFDGTEYQNLTAEKRIELIENSLAGVCGGKYFKFFLIKVDKTTVGVLNFCAQSQRAFSVAPDIKPEYRKKGYAFKALDLVYKKAKQQGFDTVIAGIRQDNEASIKLHEKLGFLRARSFKSKNGRDMFEFIKRL